ncbi:hypothetical protein GGI43DRAFT_363304 [Trichoderma evansii]
MQDRKMPGVTISQSSAAIGRHRTVEMHISCQRCIKHNSRIMHTGRLLALQPICFFLLLVSSVARGSMPTHTYQTTASLMQLRSFLAPLAYPGSLLLFLLAFSGFPFNLQTFLPFPCRSLLYHHDTPMRSHTFSWQGSISKSIHVIDTIAYLYIHAPRKGEKKKAEPIKPHPSRWASFCVRPLSKHHGQEKRPQCRSSRNLVSFLANPENTPVWRYNYTQYYSSGMDKISFRMRSVVQLSQYLYISLSSLHAASSRVSKYHTTRSFLFVVRVTP